MAKSRPDPRTLQAFHEYVKAAASAPFDLAFVLNSLGSNIRLDFSVQSLIDLEDYYRREMRGTAPDVSRVANPQEFIELACRYLGEAIIRAVDGRWVLASDNGVRFLPALTFDGCPGWAQCYPTRLAASFESLASTNPSFSGMRSGEVLAEQLRGIVKVRRRFVVEP